MKKIVCIINSSDDGGAQKMIVFLYEELKKRYPTAKLIFLHKIESQYSNYPGALYLTNKLTNLFDYLKMIKKLAIVIYKEKPDYSISFLPLSNVLSSSLGWLFGVKIRVVSQRNPPEDYGKAIAILDRILGVTKCYSYNVANSSSVYTAFSNYPNTYKKKMLIIQNCVEPADFSISKMEAKEILSIDESTKILSNIGRLHSQKDQEVIIKAMKYIECAKLYIAGDGPLEGHLKKIIKAEGLERKVVLLGNINRNKVKLLLRASDVFLIPSIYEGLSNSLLEALSYHLPVICSNIPSFTNFLYNDKIKEFNAIIVGDRDEKKWAKAISRLLDDEYSINNYAQLSGKMTKELSADKMANQFNELFK